MDFRLILHNDGRRTGVEHPLRHQDHVTVRRDDANLLARAAAGGDGKLAATQRVPRVVDDDRQTNGISIASR